VSDEGRSQRTLARRIVQASPAPRLVEMPLVAREVVAEPPRTSFWRLSLRAIPVIAALVSTSLLGYFVLSARYWQPQAQLQPEQTQQLAQKAPEQVPPKQAEPETQPVQRLPMPSDDGLLMMIQSALIALNQANVTGNYAVLRDMAAPSFQKANSLTRLTEFFAELRHRNLDLSPIVLLQPRLLRNPEINGQGMLRVTGFFPTAPERVNFDLFFRPVDGRWRLFGIGVTTTRVEQAVAAPAKPESAPAAAPAKPAAAKTATSAGKPAEKQAVSNAGGATAKKSDSDIRDQVDKLDNPPPPPQKPTQTGSFNPLNR
jgi:hypothetical protein